jgi:hypothetical protein
VKSGQFRSLLYFFEFSLKACDLHVQTANHDSPNRPTLHRFHDAIAQAPIQRRSFLRTSSPYAKYSSKIWRGRTG